MTERNRKGRYRRSLVHVLLVIGVVVVLGLSTYNQQLGHLSVLNDGGCNCADVKRAAYTSANSSFEDRVEEEMEVDDEIDTNGERDIPRVLLYITSHLPPSHEDFLHRCWPYVLSNSKLVQMADIKVFLNGLPENQIADAEVFRYVFREKIRRNKFSMHQVENQGYQAGAIAAMAMGHKNGWFEGYDWVIRVNPDVIIRDDTMILETILNSEEDNVTGIFVDCIDVCDEVSHCDKEGYLIHSDFIAFKPSSLNSEVQWTEEDKAEPMNNIMFRSIVEQGQDRWLIDSFPDITYECRLSTKDSASVAHYGNNTYGNAQYCVDWFRERNLTLNSNI